MKKSKKILIIGNKLHGKTTFANMLVKELGSAEAFSTSSYLIYRLALLNGVSEADILKDKERYRPQLVDLGNAMCDIDAGCLVSICLWSSRKDTVIIDGVRRTSEYENISGWFDLTLWIDRPSEPLGLDNLELSSKHADEVIPNHGSLDDLQLIARRIADQILAI